jgi:hypothetical protein
MHEKIRRSEVCPCKDNCCQDPQTSLHTCDNFCPEECDHDGESVCYNCDSVCVGHDSATNEEALNDL